MYDKLGPFTSALLTAERLVANTVPKMTYNVSSRTLNSTLHTILLHYVPNKMYKVPSPKSFSLLERV